MYLLKRQFAKTLSLCACRQVHYVQGQSPEPKIREYFYFVDHQGQLFLDDARIKNFTSCFKEKQFLKFFFSQLKPNTTGRYADNFPYVSLCGPERNFVRCDDVPVVFTEISHPAKQTITNSERNAATADHLIYAGGMLSVPFQPERVVMVPDTGRVYHSGPANVGGVGLIKSSLAIELSRFFEFEGDSLAPTHLKWQNCRYHLTNEVLEKLQKLRRCGPS